MLIVTSTIITIKPAIENAMPNLAFASNLLVPPLDSIANNIPKEENITLVITKKQEATDRIPNMTDIFAMELDDFIA